MSQIKEKNLLLGGLMVAAGLLFWHREDPPGVFRLSVAPSLIPQPLRPGRDFAKLRFLQNGNSERMWVIVDGFSNGVYTGILDNDPVLIVGLKAGDHITFEQRNVFQAMIEKKPEV